jgi:hypothetical protein
MTVETKWNILSAKKNVEAVNGFEGVVYSVDYNIVTSDPANTAEDAPRGEFGRQTKKLTPPYEGQVNFVPLASVTNDLLLTWLKAELGADACFQQEKVSKDKYAALVPPATEDFTPAS